MAASTSLKKKPKEKTAEEKLLVEMKETFQVFDKDGNGFISKSEFKEILKVFERQLPQKKINNMWEKVDIDGNGLIDFDEFRKLMKGAIAPVDNKKNVEDAEIMRTFKFFDKDGNGSISAKEVKEVMKGLGQKLSDPEVFDMIEAADVDGNGTIEFKEFVTLMKNLHFM